MTALCVYDNCMDVYVDVIIIKNEFYSIKTGTVTFFLLVNIVVVENEGLLW